MTNLMMHNVEVMFLFACFNFIQFVSLVFLENPAEIITKPSSKCYFLPRV